MTETPTPQNNTTPKQEKSFLEYSVNELSRLSMATLRSELFKATVELNTLLSMIRSEHVDKEKIVEVWDRITELASYIQKIAIALNNRAEYYANKKQIYSGGRKWRKQYNRK